MKFPESLEKLIESFEMYPGIGPKTAERLALFTVTKIAYEKVSAFSENLKNAVSDIKNCDICGSITDLDICLICSDDSRENKIMVVDNSKDIIAFEKTNAFKGKYHVLNGLISPLGGIGPEDINLSSLFNRVKKEKIAEIIVALPSNIAGEMTTTYIKKMLEKDECLVYRIGYGLPVGADIEYADEITLTKALEGIKKL